MVDKMHGSGMGRPRKGFVSLSLVFFTSRSLCVSSAAHLPAFRGCRRLLHTARAAGAQPGLLVRNGLLGERALLPRVEASRP